MANIAGTLVYVFNNQTGNVEALYKADSSNELLAEYEYTPFGETRKQSGDLAEKNPLRYSTRYHEGNTGLYYYGFRHYSPVTKKWLSQDPLEENGGFNLYQFANNNSINEIDVLGLNCELIVLVGHGNEIGTGQVFDELAEMSKDPSKMGVPACCYSDKVGKNFKPNTVIPSKFKGVSGVISGWEYNNAPGSYVNDYFLNNNNKSSMGKEIEKQIKALDDYINEMCNDPNRDCPGVKVSMKGLPGMGEQYVRGNPNYVQQIEGKSRDCDK